MKGNFKKINRGHNVLWESGVIEAPEAWGGCQGPDVSTVSHELGGMTLLCNCGDVQASYGAAGRIK